MKIKQSLHLSRTQPQSQRCQLQQQCNNNNGVRARFHSCCHVASILPFFFLFLCKSSLPFWCYLAVWPTMGVAVISRNYAHTTKPLRERWEQNRWWWWWCCVCEMNDKPTCSGFKKYGNTAAATHTRRGRYIRHAWEYATVFVPTLIELHLQRGRRGGELPLVTHRF